LIAINVDRHQGSILLEMRRFQAPKAARELEIKRRCDVVRIRLFSGLAILGWQVLAAFLNFAGQVDIVLGSWPDPNWYVTVLAVLVKPPAWLIAAAMASALCLLVWAWVDYRQGRISHG
jgi:hypothetical protein